MCRRETRVFIIGDIRRLVNGNADRRHKLAGAAALAAELEEVFARAIELYDAIIALIRYPHIAAGIDGKVDRQLELAIACSRRAELKEIMAGVIEHLHAIIA